MFKQALRGAGLQKYLSFDHDPLYWFKKLMPSAKSSACHSSLCVVLQVIWWRTKSQFQSSLIAADLRHVISDRAPCSEILQQRFLDCAQDVMDHEASFFHKDEGDPMFSRRMCGLTGLFLIFAAPLNAQVRPLIEGPDRTRPQLPDFQAQPQSPGTILPRISQPAVANIDSLFGGIRILVSEIRVVGNTVLTSDEVDKLILPYRDQRLSFADLENIRDQITMAYINHGFVSSGALIPDQTIQNGVVEIMAVEGKLASIDATTDGRLNQSYVRRRISLKPNEIVNVNSIETKLQMLRLNPRVGNLQAELSPGEVRGESLLRVRVSEARPESVLLRFDNYQAPTLGSTRGLADFAHYDFTGHGDTLSGTVRLTEGLRAAALTYGMPLNARDTLLSFDADVSRSHIVERPFSSLDIRSRLEIYGFTVLQPVHRSLSSEFDISITGELRRSQSFLLGSGFQFTNELSEEGISRDSVLRVGQTWTRRGVGQALAVRNSLSMGLHAFGATRNPAGIADGRFVALLSQFQWAHRVNAGRPGGQVILRSDVQLANSPLLGMEKFAIGGHSTVRGYRENEAVRDNGLIGSAELRVPIQSRADGATALELAPFVDAGLGWNANRLLRDTQTLPSAGAGLRWRYRTLTRH